MRWKTIAAGLLIVVGLGAAVFAVVGPSFGESAGTQYLTSQATVADVVEEVSATGTIEAATTYSLAFGSAPTELSSSTSTTGSTTGTTGGGSSSWTVKAVTATPGQIVKAGEVLATADDGSAALDVTMAEANLASAKARLASDKAGLSSVEKAAAKLQVVQANQSVGQARSSYSSTVAQNNLKIRQATKALADARKKLAKDRAAGKPHDVLVADQNAVVQAKNSLASLRLQVTQSNQQASNQISQASLNLKSAQYSYKQKIARADTATIATDQAAVAQAQQALDQAQAALAYTSLVSPVDGVVVAVNVTPGLAAPSSAAITVRSNDFQVGATIAESDLPQLKLGQETTVTITALDADTTGTVARIDQAPASSNSGVVSYGIVVALPEAPAGTVPGMSAEIAVTTASVPNVLAVPAIALGTSVDGSYTVRVLDATGQPQSVPVEVGLITSSMAEIKSGISEGTAVVTGTASDRTSSGSSTTTTRIPGFDAGGGGFPGGGFPGRQP
jgi:HlyD family secretion protein